MHTVIINFLLNICLLLVHHSLERTRRIILDLFCRSTLISLERIRTISNILHLLVFLHLVHIHSSLNRCASSNNASNAPAAVAI